MQAPVITIIVPCYNVASFLDRSLGSLMRQTFTDFEVIAVDDGSTDDTGQILQSWAQREPRIHVVRQSNGGPHLARLEGLRHARGAWVTFIDADDEVDTNHLESLFECVDDETGIAVGGVVAINPKGRTTWHIPPFTTLSMEEAARQLLVSHHSNGLYSCCNKLYRRELLRESWLMRPRLSYGEDQVFNLRIFIRGGRWQVRGVPRTTYRYIARPGSLMRTMTLRHIDEFFDLWSERDAAAAQVLHNNEELLRRYRLRRLTDVMDFYGNVYRTRDARLALLFKQKLNTTGWELGVPWHHPLLTARWIKWHMRQFYLGLRGCLQNNL